MALYTQRQGFQALVQQESVERGEGGAKVAQAFHTGANDKLDIAKRAIFAKDIREHQAMITFRWLGKLRKFTIAPIVISSIDNHTTYTCPVSADPFGDSLNHDICTMLQRFEKISGSSECIVHDKR